MSNKGNQTKKFDQSIKHDRRIICLEKSSIKCGGETIPRIFSKKQKIGIPLDQQSKLFLQIIFIACQGLGYRNILKLSVSGRPLAFVWYKVFLKNKKRLRTSHQLVDSFPAWSLKKIFSLSYSFNWSNFIVWLPLSLCVLQFFVNQVVTW